jgi:hypothetical protein
MEERCIISAEEEMVVKEIREVEKVDNKIHRLCADGIKTATPQRNE